MIFPLGRTLLLSLCGITNAAHPSLSTKDISLAESRRPSCIQETGRIFVTSDAVNGYLSSQPNVYGGYGAVTNTTEDALQISFCKPKHLEGHPHRAVFEIDTLNGFEDFPLLGGVKGYYSTDSDLNTTSGNYVYIAGTVSVPRGPAIPADNSFSNSSSLIPLEPVESFIWTITASNVLHPLWINSDGDTFTPPLAHYVDPDAGFPLFLLVGSPEMFVARFGGQIPAAEFTFVPDTAY